MSCPGHPPTKRDWGLIIDILIVDLVWHFSEKLLTAAEKIMP